MTTTENAGAARSPLERALLERDLFRNMLDLAHADDVEGALDGALALMLELSDAERGYIELRDPADPADAPPRWWRAHACDETAVSTIRMAVSRGIVGAAIDRGETVETSSAHTDPRFGERESVRRHQIEAVLCAPLTADQPQGVVYLQGRRGGGAFGPDIRRLVELFAQHSDAFVGRVLDRARSLADPTRDLRAKIRSDSLVGRSPAIAKVLETIALVAPLDTTVLLLGESGTGKSVVARLIAANGPRAGMPLVELNCAAIPESLVESELFGAAAGAHSTARTRTVGKVAIAEGGTLFLDEIGELELRSQAKLLQLIQDRVYYPLGAVRPVRCNVRVIAASNLDLERAVAKGTFRQDLYYRLKVIPITLPGLGERREDIPLLARRFCVEACDRHGLPRLALSDGAVAAAMAATWPGHVRQLAHAVEAAVVRAFGENAAVIGQRHLFPEVASDPERQALTFQEATYRFQRTLLAETLTSVGWNVSEAARRLDIARSHAHNLIRGFGLEREDDDGRD